MSTRATYEIKDGANNHTFYIHHDGYPAGAAVYIQRMLRASGASLAERFIRGNEKAEFTVGHEAHGDTEWKYTIARIKGVIYVTAAERQPNGVNWNMSRKVTVDQFLDPYARGNSSTFDVIEPCTPQGITWSQFKLMFSETQKAVGEQIMRGNHWGIKGLLSSQLMEAMQFFKANYDGEEVPCGALFVPQINHAALNVVDDIVTSREFREHVALLEESATAKA